MQDGFVSFGTYVARELPLHRNIGMEVVYLVEGRLRWTVDGREEAFGAGSVFFTLPWQVHGSRYDHEPGNRIHFVQFKLDKAYRRPARSFRFHPALDVPKEDAVRVSRVFCGASRHAWPATRDLRWLVRTLVERLGDDADRLHVQGLFRSMIAELAAGVQGRTRAARRLSPTEKRVREFLEGLAGTCEAEWRLPAMASECGLGTTHFAAVTKSLTGDSPTVFLRRLRVARAERLLRETDLSVTNIAFDCGFSSSQLFARTFRQYTNQSATEWRRQCRAQRKRHVIEWTEEDERRRLATLREKEWI